MGLGGILENNSKYNFVNIPTHQLANSAYCDQIKVTRNFSMHLVLALFWRQQLYPYQNKIEPPARFIAQGSSLTVKSRRATSVLSYLCVIKTGAQKNCCLRFGVHGWLGITMWQKEKRRVLRVPQNDISVGWEAAFLTTFLAILE